MTPPKLGIQPGAREGASWRTGLEAARGGYADRTLVRTAGDYQLFEQWCVATGRCAFPAEPQDVADYIRHNTLRSSPGSIREYVYSIRRVHRLVSAEDPTGSPVVLHALRVNRRLDPRRPRQAIGLTPAMRDSLLSVCGDHPRGLRDRAIIQLGWDTLCRCSELLALRVEDLEVLPSGAGRVLVRRSKTDPFGRGAWAYVSPRGLCAVTAWLESCGISEGFILRRIYHSRSDGAYVAGETLARAAVNKRLRALAIDAGLPEAVVRRLSSHSFRIGAAQDLAASGASILELMRAGRWRSVDALTNYLREARINVWAEAGGKPAHRRAVRS